MNEYTTQKKIIFTIFKEHLDGIELAHRLFNDGSITTDYDMSWLDDLLWEVKNERNPWTTYE